MSDLSQMDTVAMARRRRLQREALGERPPLGPSDEPSLRDLAVCLLWLSGIALIVASLFV